MITAAIIDDEPLAHDIVILYAKEIPSLTIGAQYYSATEAWIELKKHSFDLIFLDIQMPALTGLELLKVIPSMPQVILTTAYKEFALESYELNVTDYLLKPFKFDRFFQAVTKVQDRLPTNDMGTEDATSRMQSAQAAATIFIKVDKKQVQLYLHDVCLFEAYGNYVKVWREQQCQLTPRTLTSFEQSLPKKWFVRVHKSAIVNKKHIDYIEGDRLVLRSGQQVPIGKQYKKNLSFPARV